jgi:predicted MFS family arabinose efflux permease
MFISFGFCVFAASVHIVPYAIESGTSPADAANILAIIGAAVIIGRLILGVISDRTGNRLIFIVGFISIAAASFWLIPASTIWAFTLFALVFGFFQGGLGSAEAPLTSSLFGLKYHSLIFGIAGFSFTLGGGIGPFVTGIIFDATGSYQMAFLAWAVISIAGLVLALLIKPLKVSAPRI